MKTNIIIFFLFVITLGCKEKEFPTIIIEKNDETYFPKNVRPILDEQQHRIFNYFYQGASPTGLALEGNQRGDVVTIGGTGFGLMCLIIGAERGWITKSQAALQTKKIVAFLESAERFQGVWSHWYNPDGTAHPFGDQIKTGDVIETGFLVAGLLAASEYYTANGVEKEIRDIVERLYNSINWRHYTNNKEVLHWLWYSLEDKFSLEIRGWHEGWNSYLFALAAPEPHNISTTVYQQGWQSNGTFAHPGRKFYGYEISLGANYGGCMFFSHYTLLGFNPHLLEDNYANYWKQAVNHTMINRHYCLEDAPKTFKYSEKDWGLTACMGAGNSSSYKARSPLNDDGVIAPTAALASYPYTPFYATQVLLNLAQNPAMQGDYGFGDSYNLADNGYQKKHLAIDQGPIVIMIENYRTGLIWNLLMKNQYVRRSLELAQIKQRPTYTEGFHKAIVNTKTNEYDMMMHPDREHYEIDYFMETSEEIVFQIKNSKNEIIKEITQSAIIGENLLSFDHNGIITGKNYTITFKNHSITVRLR